MIVFLVSSDRFVLFTHNSTKFCFDNISFLSKHSKFHAKFQSGFSIISNVELLIMFLWWDVSYRFSDNFDSSNTCLRKIFLMQTLNITSMIECFFWMSLKVIYLHKILFEVFSIWLKVDVLLFALYMSIFVFL